MHTIYSIFLLLFFTACSTTPEISPLREKTTKNKIVLNKEIAIDAQYEYKEIQAQRKREYLTILTLD